jgi:hypothetical protein
MGKMFVTTESLNFRGEPDDTIDNKIGSLFLTQPIEVLEEVDERWVRARATVNGEEKEGFASKKFLRKPVTKNREALIASVHREYMRFERGMGKEHVSPFSQFVGEMWKSVGINNLDGTNRDQPWSAAAISFMVRKAGKSYREFLFSPSHSRFIHQAINARFNSNTDVPFWGFRLHEVRPQIGDIVARDNPDFAPAVNFDVAKSLDSYRSHTDIVVHIDSANQRLLAIGGNVSHSVAVTVYDLAPGDFLADTRHTFALLRNITDDEAVEVA